MNSSPNMQGSSSYYGLCNQSDAVPIVAIVMCTYNGAKYLSEQLDSIIQQTHARWKLFISDDGSTDATMAIVAEYQDRYPDRIVALKGPQKGVAWNFWSLLGNKEISADFYAFCDQDDTWLPEKLQHGLSAIRSYGDLPALYCSRTKLVTATGATQGMSPLFRKRPGFKNALVQNIAGGNTMLVNHAAICRARSYQLHPADLVMHDWTLYLLVTASGGVAIYDSKPQVLYRQHGRNIIGSRSGLKSKMARLIGMIQGRQAQWYSLNCEALLKNEGLLSPEARRTLLDFEELRNARGLKAVKLLLSSGLYRQTLSGNITLLLAAWCGKL